MTSSSPVVLPLLEDGALRLRADERLVPLLRRWLPLLPYPQYSDDAGPAAIRVARGDPPSAPASASSGGGAPALRLGTADVFLDGDALHLRGSGGCRGAGDLAAGEVELAAPREGGGTDAEAVAWDLYSMCTLSSALLLGRMGRALVHAAAVVAPGGGAWLLTGDTHAGKTTTCANLIGAGWEWVSDDHVVLSRGADGVIGVEGWPRAFHLDEGWEAGAPKRVRGSVDPHARWPGRWRRSAPLAGLVFPRVEAERATELSRSPAAEALSGLLRQSPWLLADRAAAPGVLDLLRSACESPAFSLRLGLDTYRDTARLLEVLSPLSAVASSLPGG